MTTTPSRRELEQQRDAAHSRESEARKRGDAYGAHHASTDAAQYQRQLDRLDADERQRARVEEWERTAGPRERAERAATGRAI